MTNKRRNVVTSAIYNPKEFRRSRECSWDGYNPVCNQKQGRSLLSVLWTIGLALGVIYVGALAHVSPPEPLPQSGIQSLNNVVAGSPTVPLQLDATKSRWHGLVSFYDDRSAHIVATCFVRKGESVIVHLPYGQYRAQYATGASWVGRSALFGRETATVNVTTPIRLGASGAHNGMYTIAIRL